jgi:hypothetical protein
MHPGGPTRSAKRFGRTGGCLRSPSGRDWHPAICEVLPVDAEFEIASEYRKSGYDLLVIATEAQGTFIQHVFKCMQINDSDQPVSVLVVKPIAE